MKCTSLGSSPNVHGSLILATIPTNPSLMNSWLYIRYSRYYFSLTYLGLPRVLCTMFFGTWFDMSFMVTFITTKFVIICFSFYNIYIMLDFLPLLFVFCLFIIEVISYYRCASLNLRFFACKIRLGKVIGRDTRGGGGLLIFKRIKFISFINTKVKVFNI